MDNNIEGGRPLELAEQEKPGVYKLGVARHAHRLPSGKLSPKGIESAGLAGEQIGPTTEVFKNYPSDESTRRTVDTANIMNEKSGIISQKTKKPYVTREVPDIQYDILKPDLYNSLKKGSEMVDEATLREVGLSTEKDGNGKLLVDLGKLSEEEQEKIAPIREKNQVIAFEFCLSQKAVTQRLAMGLAHQLVHELEIVKRYDSRRKMENNPLKKDAILNTVTHGIISESLFVEAGIYHDSNDHETQGITNFDDIGGYIKPAESWHMEITDPNNIPDQIPVIFDGPNRPERGRVFIDKKKLLDLGDQYLAWRKTQPKLKE